MAVHFTSSWIAEWGKAFHKAYHHVVAAICHSADVDTRETEALSGCHSFYRFRARCFSASTEGMNLPGD